MSRERRQTFIVDPAHPLLELTTPQGYRGRMARQRAANRGSVKLDDGVKNDFAARATGHDR